MPKGKQDKAISTPQPPIRRTYYPGLNGLRAIAFLVVFSEHYTSIHWGWIGVDIFFVLSGFLITGILFESRNRPNRFRTFYTRRVLRIFPLYYGVFAGLLLLTPLLHLDWNRYWLFWVFHVGNYLRDFPPSFYPHGAGVAYGSLPTVDNRFSLRLGHFWSLCVEEQFYLLWPLVVFSVRSRRALIAMGVGLFSVMPLVRWWMERSLPPDAMHGLMNWGMPFRADALLLGGALAVSLHLPWGAKLLQNKSRISIPFALSIAVFLSFIVSRMDLRMPPLGHLWIYTFVDATALLVLLETLRKDSFCSRALQWKPLDWAGKLSYGAYVFHDIPHAIYGHVAGAIVGRGTQIHHWFTAAIALVATYVLAWLSFRFYESPFLRLKDKWAPE